MTTDEVSKSAPPLEQAFRDMMRAKPMRDIFYLSNLMETLRRLDPQRDRFEPTDIEAVEAAWGSFDTDVFWNGGFVVRLRDGRRAYIESDAGKGDWEGDAEIRVEMMPASLRYPKPTDELHQSLFGWDDGPFEELEEYLTRLAA